MANLFVTNTITATFHCSIEKSFKTPMMGDATKILIAPFGYPLVKGFIEDETWGIAGGSRKIIMNGFLFIKPMQLGFDEIFIRDENKYWKWGVSQFGWAAIIFTHNQGEWWVKENTDGKISVTWKYTWFSRNWLSHPFNWLFVKLFWSQVMTNGMKNIKQMAESGVPYIYNK